MEEGKDDKAGIINLATADAPQNFSSDIIRSNLSPNP